MHQYDVLPDITLGTYVPHKLHSSNNAWLEKNCYIDLYIEVLHALKLEPIAMLPFTLAVDFAGDQWTFYKPQLAEMRDLYGLEVQEMSVWRSILEHSIEHLAAGRLLSVEVDAFWLPDTQASDYRKQHTKTTIAIAKLDVQQQKLGYFHNAGYFELQDEDFRQIFRINVAGAEDYLPPYAELIHLGNIEHGSQPQLIERSIELLRKYQRYIPQQNPIVRYAERFACELPMLQAAGLEHYHRWAFNNTRQLGSAFELATAYLQWLTASGVADFNAATTHFEKISTDNKALILKVARAVNSQRQLDLSDFYHHMAMDWEQGMAQLRQKLAAL